MKDELSDPSVSASAPERLTQLFQLIEVELLDNFLLFCLGKPVVDGFIGDRIH